MKKVIGVFLFLFMILFLVSFASSHLDSGKDITNDGFIIDFGFAPSTPVSLLPTNLNVNLVNATTEKPINLTSIWIRISSKDNVVLSGEFYPKNASLPFTFTFPKGGNYSVDFDFRNNGNSVEKETFYLDVKDANSADTVYYIIGFVLLFILLFLKSYYIRKKLEKNFHN